MTTPLALAALPPAPPTLGGRLCPSISEPLYRDLCAWLLELYPQEPTSEVLVYTFARNLLLLGALFAGKQRDYGPDNIVALGEDGVRKQLMVKLLRLQHLEGKEAVNEAKDDSWLDAADYGLIGYMVHRGEWPHSFVGI